MNPFRRLNRGAFSGALHCPLCSKHVDSTTTAIGFESDKPKLEFVENIGPFIRVYRCRHCNGRFRYDIARDAKHPYSSFKRGLKLKGINFNGYVPILKV